MLASSFVWMESSLLAFQETIWNSFFWDYGTITTVYIISHFPQIILKYMIFADRLSPVSVTHLHYALFILFAVIL